MKKISKKVLYFFIIINIMLMPNYIYANVETTKIAAIKDMFDDDGTIYKEPDISNNGSNGGSMDDILNSGNSFLNQGNSSNSEVSQSELADLSSVIYSILTQVAVAVAVIVGAAIGIKFMTGSVEDKANIKELLWPYVMGCVVVFGSLGIWRLVVTVLQGTV